MNLIGAPGRAFFVSADRHAQGREGWIKVSDIFASPIPGASAGTKVKVVDLAVKPEGKVGVAVERWERYEVEEEKPAGGGEARHVTDEMAEGRRGGRVLETQR